MNKISPRTKSGTAEHRRLSEPVGFMLTLLFASLTIYVLSLAYNSIASSDSYYAGTITVSGHGIVEIKPDVQKLSVDVAPATSTASSTAKTATSTTDYAKNILVYLKSKGVPDSDIRIVSPRSIVVKLRGPNMTNAKTIEADVEKLASAKSITARLEDPEVENLDQIKSRALDMALSNAKMNAIKVSRSLGTDLGKLASFYDNNDGSESENYDPNVYTSDISVSYQVR